MEKTPGTLRLAVLEDSIAAGFNLRETGRKPFPALLEEILRRPDRAVEVLNFAVDGYGTLQEAAAFGSKVLPFDPDVVILQYCLNDPGLSFTPAAWFLDTRRPTSWLLSYLRSRLAREEVTDLDPRRGVYVPSVGPVTPELVQFWRLLYEPDSPPWQRVERGFAEIGRVAAERGIPVVLVHFPLNLIPNIAPELRDAFRRQVLAAARENGFHVVDLSLVYRDQPGIAVERETAGDHYHPGPLGHRLAAEALAECLRKEKLLE